MLKIRTEQMEALSRNMVEQFEDRMMVHLRSRFGEHLDEADDEELREFIQAGIEKARGFGIETRFTVQRYLEFMVVLGRDFDSDPEHSGAGRTLRHPRLKPMHRLDNIEHYIRYDLGVEY